MSSYLFIFWITHLSGCAGLLCSYSKQNLLSISCCDCDLAITYIKAEITSGIPKEAAGLQESTGWYLGAHCTYFGSHSNNHPQPLMADHQGVMESPADRPGSHSSTADKRTLSKSFKLVIFIQQWLKRFLPLMCLLCDMYATSLYPRAISFIK